MVLRYHLGSLSDNKQLREYLKQKLNFNWTEETSAILLKFCQKFCSNICGRWQRSNRTLACFLKRNGDWLKSAIIWPKDLMSQRENVLPDEDDENENLENLAHSAPTASTSS